MATVTTTTASSSGEDSKATLTKTLEKMTSSAVLPQQMSASHANELSAHSSLKNPSALTPTSLTEIATLLTTHPTVIFLDYDGTLSPIVKNPSEAVCSPETKQTLEKLSNIAPTAIITGRAIKTITQFITLPTLYYAGSHGFDMRERGGQHKVHAVADDYLPLLGQVRDRLATELSALPGSLLEDNVYSLSVHYRNLVNPETDLPKLLSLVEQAVQGTGKADQLQVLPGKMVQEIRPRIEWHKGEAVKYLRSHITSTYNSSSTSASASSAAPSTTPSANVVEWNTVYLGDDTTDEDAFKVLAQDDRSIGILVLPEGGGERLTFAKYMCQQTQVREFLELIADMLSKKKPNL